MDQARVHCERLLDTVDWVLNQGGISLTEVEALAVSAGPGSFTGLRVGVAAWKGLALAGNLPLVPVPTLDAMARLVPSSQQVVCPVLDAKMGEVFGAVYEVRGETFTKTRADCVGVIEDLLAGLPENVLFLGDGSVRYRERIVEWMPGAVFAPAHCSVPRAAAVAEQARRLLREGVSSNAADVSPVYLRRSQAEEALSNNSGGPVANG